MKYSLPFAKSDAKGWRKFSMSNLMQNAKMKDMNPDAYETTSNATSENSTSSRLDVSSQASVGSTTSMAIGPTISSSVTTVGSMLSVTGRPREKKIMRSHGGVQNGHLYIRVDEEVEDAVVAEPSRDSPLGGSGAASGGDSPATGTATAG